MRAETMLAGLAGVFGLSACALVLGFEDKQPLPDDDGSGGSGAATTSTGGGGVGGLGVGGGAGGMGAGGVEVLLITDPSTDSVGMYDPMDGTYFGDFVPPPTGAEPYDLGTPNNAVQGPDGKIYVSDQITDVILRFEADGTFDRIFTEKAIWAGVDNVRGMDFRDNELFASVSPPSNNTEVPAVARFDLDGNYLGNFVEDSTNPFDVFFTGAGTLMMANITDPDDVRLYDVDGTSFTELLEINFPQQIQQLPNGNYVVAAWTDVVEFQIDGTVVRQIGDLSSCSGVYPTGDGQWLITSADGVQSMNPFSGQVIDTKRVGASFLKIELVRLPESVLE